jgi:hypothetical protein
MHRTGLADSFRSGRIFVVAPNLSAAEKTCGKSAQSKIQAFSAATSAAN